MHHVIQLIHLACFRPLKTLLLPLNVCKAFTTLSWQNMHFALCKWGFGDDFIAILFLPICFNKISYKCFPVIQSNWEGCPLTLILFILALKPVAVIIQTDPSTWTPEISNTYYKIMLYTNNILLNSTSPHITLLNLFSTLGFQSNLGLKVN